MTDERKQYISNYKKEREKKCYPPPKYVGLLEAYSQLNKVTESSVLSHALKCFFDTMPINERLQLQRELQKAIV